MQFELDAFTFDEARYELRAQGVRVELDAKALDLLAYLVRRPGQLVRKEELFEAVWPDSTVADNALAVAVSKLRKAFQTAALRSGARPTIENVYGRGYRLLCNDVRTTPARATSAALRELAQSESDPHAEGAAAEGPLVGRAEALLRLDKARQLARAGRGNVVLVTGEPGIGKTRLAEEFSAQEARLGTLCVWGQFRPFGSIRPLAGWLSLLREGALLCQDPALQAELLATTTRWESGGADLASFAASSALPSAIDELSRSLRALSRARPTSVFLDDVQWADSASLQLLAELVADVGRTSLLVVVTLRCGEPQAGDRAKLLAYVAGHRNAQRVPLRPLPYEEVARYVAALFGNATEELKQAVYSRSEGTPFFMVHLLRPHRGGAAPSLASLTLAGEAYEIVRQRLELLEGPQRELLRIAAVLGRRIDLRLLGELTERDPLVVRDALQGATAEGFVRRHPASPAQLEFEHEVIVVALCEQVATDERARIHLAASLALERRAKSGDAVDLLEVLLHRLAASPHGEVRCAAREAQRVARGAVRCAAHGDACALLARALEALALAGLGDVRLEAELAADLAFSARVSSHPARSTYLAHALRLAEAHGFADLLARLGMQMSPSPGALVERDAGQTLAAAAQALADSRPPLLARVLAHQSWTPPFSFDRASVEALGARALMIASTARDVDATRAALSAQAYFAGANRELARAIATQIMGLTSSAPSEERSFWRSRTSFSAMVMALQEGDLAGFETACADYGAAGALPRNPELLWHHERARTIDRMNRGDYVGANERLAALADKAHQLQLEVGQTICAADQFLCMRETSGIPGGLFGAAALGLSDADSPCVRARKLRTMAELGHPSAAQSLEAFGTAAILALPADRDCIATLAHLSVASVAAGARAHVALIYELLRPHSQLFVTDLSLYAEGSVEHYLGLLAAALGRTDDAAAHFESAASACERAGFHARTLHARLALAELVQTKQPARARQIASELAKRARGLGLAPLAQRAAAVLARGS